MIRGPWYISVKAVRDYLALTKQPNVTDGPIFRRGEADLIAMAEKIVASGKTGRPEQSGALTYRIRYPDRSHAYRLTVMSAPRTEGDRPQLVRVSRG